MIKVDSNKVYSVIVSLMDQFLELCGINKRGNDPLMILSNLNLVGTPENTFKNAGVLLFAKDVRSLAFEYVKSNVISNKHINDTLHIGVVTT